MNTLTEIRTPFVIRTPTEFSRNQDTSCYDLYSGRFSNQDTL